MLCPHCHCKLPDCGWTVFGRLWHPSFTAGRRKFHAYEAAFQAQKCPERAAEFANLTPSEAKHLGRHVELRHDWENIKDNIMFGVVKAKFSQNANLKQKLLATGNSRLFEENNWGDTCWGTVNGKGENRLGLILEDVRDLLREE